MLEVERIQSDFRAVASEVKADILMELTRQMTHVANQAKSVAEQAAMQAAKSAAEQVATKVADQAATKAADQAATKAAEEVLRKYIDRNDSSN